MTQIIPTTTAIFAKITRYASDDDLFGITNKGLYAYVGGKVNQGETDIFRQTFEREIFQGAFATLNPTNFNNPRYKLHFVLAHPTPFMCLMDDNHQPIRWGQSVIGGVHLKIVLRMFEVNPHQNPPVAGEELSELGFYKYTALQQKKKEFRNLVHVVEKQQPKAWRKLLAPRPFSIVLPSVGAFRAAAIRENLHEDFIETHFSTRPSAAKPYWRPTRQAA